MALIDKLPAFLNTGEAGKAIKFPDISFMKPDYSSWPLRFSLLLIGVGLGCLLAFFVQNCYLDYSRFNVDEWRDRQNVEHIRFILYFSFIAICGGLSLMIAYLIERRQEKKQVASGE